MQTQNLRTHVVVLVIILAARHEVCVLCFGALVGPAKLWLRCWVHRMNVIEGWVGRRHHSDVVGIKAGREVCCGEKHWRASEPGNAVIQLLPKQVGSREHWQDVDLMRRGSWVTKSMIHDIVIPWLSRTLVTVVKV